MNSLAHTPIVHPHSVAKNWHDIAQIACAAYWKQHANGHPMDLPPEDPSWEGLSLEVQACWVAVAKQMWAEHTLMRGLMHQHFHVPAEDSEGGAL